MAAKKKTNMISIILGIGHPAGKPGKAGAGACPDKCPKCGYDLMDEGAAHESAPGDKTEDTKEAPMPKGKGAAKAKLAALKEMMG